MKARIIKTGEIVDVIEMSHSVVHPKVYSITFLSNGNYVKIDNADEFEILPDEPDWNQIKIQAAIAAMQGMITGNYSNSSSCATIRALAKKEKLLISDVVSQMAIEYAKSLVEELKKQTK